MDTDTPAWDSAVESETFAKPCLQGPVSGLRYREILVLQCPPLMGMACAIGPWSSGKISTIALFTVASLLLVAHVWALNDWADLSLDGSNPKKAGGIYTSRGMPRRAMLWLSLQLLVASLAIFALLPARTFLVAVTLSALGAVYSLPPIHGKRRPLLSSGLHFAGGMLHFLLGYSLFSPVWSSSLLVAPFFALVFTAGHAIQEVQDLKFDRACGVRTNAVCFGPRTMFFSALGAFALAYGYLGTLAWNRIVPAGILFLLPGVAALHALWSIKALVEGLTFESVQRLRGRYRFIFAALGLYWFYSLFS